MSLINQALKQAQRERTQRAAESGPAMLGESFFPYPSGKKHRAPGRALIIGGTAIVLLAIAGATILRVRAMRGKNGVSAPVRTPTPVPTIAAAPPAATPAPAPASEVVHEKTQVPVAAPPKAPASQSRASNAPPRYVEPSAPVTPAPKQVAATSPTARDTAKDSILANAAIADAAVRSAPAPLTAPQPTQTVTPPSVRVVIDPIGLRPGDSLFARAFAEHQRGNLDAAADLYERALRKPPVAPELYNDYGALLATRQNYTAAIPMYRLGIAANPDDPKLRINLGDAFRETGRRADALSEYFQAGKLDPANIAVKVRLAGEYQAIGDTANARRLFEEAIKAAPNDPEARYGYASFLQSVRDYRGAARELQRFVDVAPGKMPQDVIDRVKIHLANLRRQFP